MPLVAFSPLPTFNRLAEEFHCVLSLEKAKHQDIRELHLGLLNLMPDPALQATERQFMRLVGDCNQIVQFYLHLFTLPSIPRGEEAKAWIRDYYQDFAQIKAEGLDALIISGANPCESDLEQEVFWPELVEVVDWARENVTSTLCACFASHAVMQHLYAIRRQALSNKLWGVFQHRLTQVKHPLTRHMNTRFDVPHSRYNQVTRSDLEKKQLICLVESGEAGVHLATSPDGLRFVFFQGHPEYDHHTLLKEYKREIDRWCCGERPDYPPFPQNYFRPEVEQGLTAYRDACLSQKPWNQQPGILPQDWPQDWLEEQLDNTWRDSALATFNNWLGLVYQLTGHDRKKPFMDGVDGNDPLKSD